MILGVVLAGGQSTRFGSDKALAELGGHTLLARAVDALSGWCEHVIVAGRETAPAPTIPDWPNAGMGPLAGIAAGLHHARDEGYDSVLTCGVDSVNLPENLLELLSPLLLADGRHSMLAFAEALGATAVKIAAKPANINTPADLTAAEKNDGI